MLSRLVLRVTLVETLTKPHVTRSSALAQSPTVLLRSRTADTCFFGYGRLRKNIL
jgi:hypothetical protein